MAISKAQASRILFRLGWRVDTTTRYNQALKNFQIGWHLGNPLKADGLLGDMTSKALLLSEARRAQGLGTASANFSFSEVACKCGGRYSDCQRIWLRRSVFATLEKSRRHIGKPISVTSGCRCRNHNNAVGGAKESQHLYGLAIDWRGPDKDVTRGWKIWHGIGYGGRSDLSLHTDLRPGATPLTPTTWIYSSS